MTVREKLNTVLDSLSEKRLGDIFDFAVFLSWREAEEKQERDEWRQFGLSQLARAYGDDEPEYTEADLKPGPRA